MEGIFLVLVGGALFAQSWYILGLYSEGRTMGVFVGGLGLASLIAITLSPMLLQDTNTKGVALNADFVVAATMVMKSLIVLWAVYAVGVAAHGILDFDERPIGFYCAFLAVVTFASFLFFALRLQGTYSDGTWLALSAATLALSVVATIVCFYLAFGFGVLRLVAGWSVLLGGIVAGLIGVSVLTTLIFHVRVTPLP